MTSDRIDFISEYCDRWCERCAYTARCSAFAARAAIAMCGDVEAGFELALGEPHPEGNASPPERLILDDIENVEVPAGEIAAEVKKEEQRDAEIRDTPIMSLSWGCTLLAFRWLEGRYEPLLATADGILREALRVASHDTSFIGAKLYRALHGHATRVEDGDDHPIQNDWNGSAKIALISLDRSEHAWRVIADATAEETPRALADQLRDLRRQVVRAFPNAWSFVRPGFDEPGR